MEIKKELVIRATSARVYKAITDPKELTQWFPDVATLEPKIGGKIHFKFSQFKTDDKSSKNYLMDGKVIELEENKKLAYTWGHPNIPEFPPTKVIWTLEEIGEGMTKVTIIHTGFSDDDMMRSFSERWVWFTGRLSVFAVSKRQVNVGRQLLSTFLPGMDALAFYRIKKFRKYFLYIATPLIVSSLVTLFIAFGIASDFQNKDIGIEERIQSGVILTSFLLLVSVAFGASSNYLMHKWSEEWNRQFLDAQ